MSYKREITTLGRGGSDTTAVALAAALSASRCEIYSDVDGVYSADPRAVPDASHLPELSHEMLQEMAECGAKVVCAQAVEWARRAGIAIYARSTFDPVGADSPRQTVIRKFAPSERLTARAVVAEGNVVLARLDDASRLDDLLRVAAEAKVSFKDLASGARGASMIVPLLNVPDWPGAKRQLAAAIPSLELTEGVAVVSVVGDGLAATPDPLVRFLDAVRSAGVTPRAISATALRLSAVIDAPRSADAQRALHAAFVAG